MNTTSMMRGEGDVGGLQGHTPSLHSLAFQNSEHSIDRVDKLFLLSVFDTMTKVHILFWSSDAKGLYLSYCLLAHNFESRAAMHQYPVINPLVFNDIMYLDAI